MEKNKNKPKKTGNAYNLYPENTASSTDCTGLMPSNPSNQDEIESYKDIYPTADKGKRADEEKNF